MSTAGILKERILSPSFDFNAVAMQVFQFQAAQNPVYNQFITNLKLNPSAITDVKDIPFLPVSFFKTHDVICTGTHVEHIFTSSGTTGADTSRHLVGSLSFYKQIFTKAFRHFYKEATPYCLLALLPSYLERSGSSLVYMAAELIKESGHAGSGFFLNNHDELRQRLIELESQKQRILLLGVSFALLDFADKYPMHLHHTTIMETGGMKGKRKEMIREDLHAVLKNAFHVPAIHSEYGMTELLSQAYSKGQGLFHCPPWMQVVVKEMHDPLGENMLSKSGAIHVIDLANVDSCSFIATQDMGRKFEDGSFEILGRFDNSDIRGCNLLID